MHGSRRIANAKTHSPTQLVGLGAAAGVALTIGMIPLVAIPSASADVIDAVIDSLMGVDTAVDPSTGLDVGDVGASFPTLSGVFHDLDEAWIESPLGQSIDSMINVGTTALLGHDLITTSAVAPDATPVMAAVAASPAAVGGTDAGVRGAYVLTSQWNDGFTADYTITNTGTTPITDWQAQFDLPTSTSITNMWNANFNQDGAQYVLTPESYDSTIQPGQAITIGFQASDNGNYSAPTNFDINGSGGDSGNTTGGSDSGSSSTTTGGGSGNTTGGSDSGSSSTTGGSTTTGGGGSPVAEATYALTSQWNNGFNGGYTIANPGNTPLADWKLQFDLPANESITNVWNAVMTHSGTHYVLTPESYNNTIAPDGSTSVGFTVSDNGDYSPPANAEVNGQSAGGATGGDEGSSTGTGTGTGSSGSGSSGSGSTGSGSTGSGSTGSSTGSGSSGGQILTGQYQQTHVENDYAVQNNAYNIGGGSQEIETTPAGFTLVSVAGSAPTNGAPLSYPSIFLGCAYTLCSIDSPLPEQLSDINSATSSIDYTYPTGGTWDASYDIWLDPQPLTNGVNQQEIMIWFNHQGSIQPVGHVVGDDDIDGKDFTVWEGSNGQNQVVSYVADTPISSWHNFNVLGFIDNTETLEPAMTDSWYLTSVQAGFEPWNGGAGLAINNFSANVNGTS